MSSNNLVMVRILFLTLLLVVIGFAPSEASVAEYRSFDEKVAGADTIILGRCLRTRSAYDSTGRWILTYSTFAVDKSFKGAPPLEVTVVTPGGAVNGLRQETIGIPQFRPGDKKVLFVKNDRVGPTVLYFDQGTYEVRDEARGMTLVAPVTTELVLIDTQTGRAAAAEERIRSLAEFEKDVRASLARTGRRGTMKAAAVSPKSVRPAIPWWEALLSPIALAIAAILAIGGVVAWVLTRPR